jgi:Sulfotransferase family
VLLAHRPARGYKARMRVEQRLIWILGSPRSGSTWLMTMLIDLLGAHGVNEPLIGAHLAVPGSPVVGQSLPNDPTLADLRGDNLSYFFAKSKAHVWRPPLRRLLLERLADGSRRRQWIVVKEPNGSLAAPVIMATLPQSRLLFLVRDGRDVVDSWLDGWSSGWLTSTFNAGVSDREQFLYDAARRWVRFTESVRTAFVAHPHPLRIRTTYESLRADPQKDLRRVLAWLGQRGLRDRVPEVVARTSFEAIPETEKGPGRFVRSATPGLWREHFNEEEQAVLSSIMGPTLKKLGYED